VEKDDILLGVIGHLYYGTDERDDRKKDNFVG